MLTVWRIVTPRYAKSAFSGEGARLHGGRWNPKGVAMVYTASTQSLATLELLVQDDSLLANYVMIPATIPAKLKIEKLDLKDLPEDWQASVARDTLRDIGSDWIRRATSAVLAVPSTIIPSESNYLLNPLHPTFAKIKLGAPQDFVTDMRLLRKLR